MTLVKYMLIRIKQNTTLVWPLCLRRYTCTKENKCTLQRQSSYQLGVDELRHGQTLAEEATIVNWSVVRRSIQIKNCCRWQKILSFHQHTNLEIKRQITTWGLSTRASRSPPYQKKLLKERGHEGKAVLAWTEKWWGHLEHGLPGIHVLLSILASIGQLYFIPICSRHDQIFFLAQTWPKNLDDCFL
jgi:hypothetical protein